MSQHHLPDFSGLRNRAITVYCWSRTQPETPLWAEAERLGKLAVENGFSVITGGYCGSMEAVSKGAREALEEAKKHGKWNNVELTYTDAPTTVDNIKENNDHQDGDGHANATQSRKVCLLSEQKQYKNTDKHNEQISNDTNSNKNNHDDVKVNDDNNKCKYPEVIGVVVSGIFPDRVKEGNKYLTMQHDSTSMMHRIEQLTSLSRYYIILPGTLGTLQELCCIWIQKLLHPSTMPGPLILAYREPWEKCLRGIAESLHIPDEQMQLIHFVDDADDAIKLILEDDRLLHTTSASSSSSSSSP